MAIKHIPQNNFANTVLQHKLNVLYPSFRLPDRIFNQYKLGILMHAPSSILKQS